MERNNNSPPSRLKGVFEALVFARHVLGVVEFQHLIDSRRCLGACGNDPFHIVKQASPLTVKQLCRLHSVLESSDEDWDRLFAGMPPYTALTPGVVGQTPSMQKRSSMTSPMMAPRRTLRLQLLFTRRQGP